MRDTSEVDTCPRCQKCDRWRTAPDVLRDPMLLWERFPCPPPGTDHTRLILELDWTGQIGTSSGCEALKRVARRCHVDLKQIDNIPTSLVACEDLFEGISLCGAQCIIAVILAVICFLSFLLLVVVCRRYVRGTNKESSTICTKVLTSEHAAENTQINKYYVQNQYYHRPSNIPERRRLPCEARLVENGVEARLLKAIQETPAHHNNKDDLCPQCLAESRQSTLKYIRNRPGYETICWNDKDYFQKRVPSMDSINRQSLGYQRSINGSSSDVSHLYEYISDYPYAPSYNSVGRSSSHSQNPYSRTNSLKRNNAQSLGDYNAPNENESVSRQLMNKERVEHRDNQNPTRRSFTSIHSKYDERSNHPRYLTERSPYQPSGSDSSTYQKGVCDKVIYKGYYSDIPPDLISETNRNYVSGAHEDSESCFGRDKSMPNKASVAEQETTDNLKSIKGYKYVFNPSYYDKANPNVAEDTPVVDYDKCQTDESPSDVSIEKLRQKRRGKSRRKSSDSYNSNCTESTSLSGSYNTNVFRKDRNIHRVNKS